MNVERIAEAFLLFVGIVVIGMNLPQEVPEATHKGKNQGRLGE